VARSPNVLLIVGVIRVTQPIPAMRTTTAAVPDQRRSRRRSARAARVSATQATITRISGRMKVQ
jgi:hypothetical protein